MLKGCFVHFVNIKFTKFVKEKILMIEIILKFSLRKLTTVGVMLKMANN